MSRPTVEEVRLRLFGACGQPPAPQRVPACHRVWLRTVFDSPRRRRVGAEVWGASVTTRSLERAGALQVEDTGRGWQRVRLTRLGHEALS